MCILLYYWTNKKQKDDDNWMDQTGMDASLHLQGELKCQLCDDMVPPPSPVPQSGCILILALAYGITLFACCVWTYRTCFAEFIVHDGKLYRMRHLQFMVIWSNISARTSV